MAPGCLSWRRCWVPAPSENPKLLLFFSNSFPPEVGCRNPGGGFFAGRKREWADSVRCSRFCDVNQPVPRRLPPNTCLFSLPFLIPCVLQDESENRFRALTERCDFVLLIRQTKGRRRRSRVRVGHNLGGVSCYAQNWMPVDFFFFLSIVLDISDDDKSQHSFLSL